MINPKALKTFRKRRKMTQEKLAEAVKCTKDTVSRWERGTSTRVRKEHRRNLCGALGVKWEELSGTTDDDALHRLPQKTKVTIDVHLRNHLQLVAERYGISLHDVIHLAPLLLVIVAEQSLVWRRNRLAGIESTLAEMQGMQEKLTDLSERLGETFAVHGDDDDDMDNSLLEEKESLKDRDVFGCSISRSNVLWNQIEDPENPRGPFIDFILELKRDFPGEAVDWMGSLDGKMIDRYLIATDTIKSLTGLFFTPYEPSQDNGFIQQIFDDEASIDLRQCIRVRQERDESGYREWLSEQMPECKVIPL